MRRPDHYADSSFLVSCYILDMQTAQAKSRLSRTAAPLAITSLQGLEVRNAFELGVFRGLFSAADAAAARSNLEKDLRGGRLLRFTVNWPATMRIAARLSAQHSAVMGTRSLDLPHVAAAKALRAADFVSFDIRQPTLAAAVGLRVAP